MAKIEPGAKFGDWTVIEKVSAAQDRARSLRWLCQCVCGRRKIVYQGNLLSGASSSCGCSKRIDLSGRRFGRLMVLRPLPKRADKTEWHCVCDCGNERAVETNMLTRGHIHSCGCLIHRRYIKQNGGRLHRIYSGMKSRCNNPNATGYQNYGGRGIKVCAEWQSDFWAFHAWAVNNGYADGLTIDRMDNDKGYSPDNCRWVTPAEQNRNKRNTKRECVVNA